LKVLDNLHVLAPFVKGIISLRTLGSIGVVAL
jgi:hypothetical protein